MNADFQNNIPAIVSFAESVSQYFNTLIKEGMSREEALAVTIGWQNSIIAQMTIIKPEEKK